MNSAPFAYTYANGAYPGSQSSGLVGGVNCASFAYTYANEAGDLGGLVSKLLRII